MLLILIAMYSMEKIVIFGGTVYLIGEVCGGSKCLIKDFKIMATAPPGALRLSRIMVQSGI